MTSIAGTPSARARRRSTTGPARGHIPVRMGVMRDPGEMVPVADAASRAATEEELRALRRRLKAGLDQSALAVGFGIQYTPAATRWEILEAFRLAAEYGATCHVHMRGMGHVDPLSSVEGLEELIAATAITGASVHVAHIGEAQGRGIDVTTECYPYHAALTDLRSAMFDEGWQTKLGIDYGDLEWAATNERLTESTFARYKEVGGLVVMHMIPDETVLASVASPLTAIATDGLVRNGKGHPRTAGSYSRVLGRFVRDDGAVELMEALRKSSLMPAQRLEERVPMMRNKGRVRVGADADVVAFDAERIIDTATYDEPTLAPKGMVHVLVNGVPVVRDGSLQEGATPGRPVRAPVG